MRIFIVTRDLWYSLGGGGLKAAIFRLNRKFEAAKIRLLENKPGRKKEDCCEDRRNENGEAC